MRKKDETLRETLLDCARQLAYTQGPGAVNIREIAKRAGVATGTVYTYFPSKEAILLTLTEEYWRAALEDLGQAVTASSFCGQLAEIYTFLHARLEHAGALLMGSVSGAAGQARMQSMQGELSAALLGRLHADHTIRTDCWDETFTKQAYAGFLVQNLLLLMQTRAPDAGFLLALVRRTLY